MFSNCRLRIDQTISFIFCLVLLLIQGSLSLLRPAALSQETALLELIEPAPRPIRFSRNQVAAVIDNQENDEKNYKILKSQTEQTTGVNFSETSSGYTSSIGGSKPFSESLASISADSYVVVDLASAAVLLEENKDQPLPPASAAKLMSVLVAKNLFVLDSIVLTGPEIFIAGNRIGLSLEKQVRVIDLIKASLISSGNDAIQALAHHCPLGYDGFVKAMNEKAQQLSLNNTRFANATGFDHPNQFSSSYDLALLAREVIRDPVFKNFIQLPEAKIKDVEGNIVYQLSNTNQLLRQYDQVKGVKTGTTNLAGQVLITLWEEDDYSLLIVVMGSEDRYQDTLALVDWVQHNIVWQEF